MNVRTKQTTDRSLNIVVSIVVTTVVAVFGLLPSFVVSASVVQDRFIQLETPAPSGIGLHKVGFTITDFATPLGSIRIQYCGNDPIIGSPCVAPAGFSANDTSIASQSGATGFTLHGSSNQNNVVLSRSPATPTQGELEYELANITNPSNLGAFYARIFTYPTNDGTGPHTQAGGIAMTTSVDLNVEAEVPPYLTFCSGVEITGFDCGSVNSFFIQLGELSETSPTTATSQMVIATNAESGYTVRMNGTSLTSGNNLISPLENPTSSQPGVSQFGVNLRNNTSPNIGANPTGSGSANPANRYNNVNQFAFRSGDIIASASGASDTRKFTVSYLVNIGPDQAAGVYSTTIGYLTLANF